MKDLITIELPSPNLDLAWQKAVDSLENIKESIEEITHIDIYVRFNIKDNTRTYYYAFEVRK